MVNWIIENLAGEPSYTELADAVKKAGMPLLEIKGDYTSKMVSDFVHPVGGIYLNNSIFNGSIEMSKLLRESFPTVYPMCYNSFEKYKCSSYYSHFGNYLFNDRYSLCSLFELKRNKFLYYGIFGKEAILFVRPDSGEKTFQAQLIDILDIDRFVDSNAELGHDLVLISTPKNIKWEGRIVVSREKGIIAHSTYRYQGQVTKIPAIPNGAKDLANELLKVPYYPDKVFCYDLCEDSDGKFWLMELTSFSSAGLYACDKDKIVESVSQIVEEDKLNKTYV